MQRVLSIARVMSLLVLVWSGAAMAQSSHDHGWTLAEVMQRATQAGRPVQSAVRAVESARADRLGSAATPSPQLSLNAQSIDPSHLGHGSLWSRPIDTILRLDQTIERGGKRVQRERVAAAGLLAAELEAADARRLQQQAASSAYWDLKLAQAQHDIAVRNTQLALDSSQAAQKRAALGDVSRLEATRLRVEADRAANEEAVSQQNLQQARWALMQVLALESEVDGSRLDKVLAVDPWPVSSDWPVRATSGREGLACRADVLAAMRRVEQAQAALDLAQAQRVADVTVGVQFEHSPPNGSHLLGVGVSLPLGVDGRQEGPVRKATVALAEAQAQSDAVMAQAQMERDRTQGAVQWAQTRLLRLQTQIVPQSLEALKAAEFARQQGALSLQDVLDARRTLHAAELELAAVHADFAKAQSVLVFQPVCTSPSSSL